MKHCLDWAQLCLASLAHQAQSIAGTPTPTETETFDAPFIVESESNTATAVEDTQTPPPPVNETTVADEVIREINTR